MLADHACHCEEILLRKSPFGINDMLHIPVDLVNSHLPKCLGSVFFPNSLDLWTTMTTVSLALDDVSERIS